jgi:hypothetical protein
MNKKQRKIQPAHPLTTGIMQTYAHANSLQINGERRCMEFALAESTDAAAALRGALTRERRKQRDLRAGIAGLTAVVAKR